MINPLHSGWKSFISNQEALIYLKNAGLIPPTQTYLQRFTYSGAYTEHPVACLVVGHAEPHLLVLEIGQSLHCIHSDYLLEMQTGHFREPVEYVVLDLETTGLSPKRDQIVEFAAVKYSSGIEIDSFSTLINPECEMSPIAEAVHGISPELLKDAPCLKDVIQQIRDFIATVPIVAHNASFDSGFLKVAYESQGLTFKNKVIDTLKLAREAFPSLPNHKLATLKQHLNIQIDAAHRALPDVYATAQLFTKCIEIQNACTLQPELNAPIADLPPNSSDDSSTDKTEKFEEEEKAFALVWPHLGAILDAWNLPREAVQPFLGQNFYAVKFYSTVICRFCFIRKRRYIEIPESYADFVPVGAEYERPKSKSDTFIKLFANSAEDVLRFIPMFCSILDAEILSTPKTYSCCHLYAECSDARRCVHPNKDFAKSCSYKYTLKSGKVFFGKNRNIDDYGKLLPTESV